MNQLLNLVRANLKSMLRIRMVLVYLLVIPLGALFLSWLVTKPSESAQVSRKMKVVLADPSESPGDVLKGILAAAKLSVDPKLPKAEALARLSQRELLAVYEIPKGFEAALRQGQKKPLRSYKLEPLSAALPVEAKLEEAVEAMLRAKALAPYTKDAALLCPQLVQPKIQLPKDWIALDSFLPILMLLYSISMAAAPIANRLLVLRRDHIFERLLSTQNSGRAIMGSFFLSWVILQGLVFSATIVVMHQGLHLIEGSLTTSLIFVLLMCFFNIALATALTRLIRSEALISSISTMSSVIFFFLYMGSLMPVGSELLTQWLARINWLNPFYWAATGVQQGRWFPEIPILLLMIFVLFTAGSLRLSSFAREA